MVSIYMKANKNDEKLIKEFINSQNLKVDFFETHEDLLCHQEALNYLESFCEANDYDSVEQEKIIKEHLELLSDILKGSDIIDDNYLDVLASDYLENNI